MMDQEMETAAPGERDGGGNRSTSTSIIPPSADGENPPDVDLTRAAARRYHARGWVPIAYEHRTKAPKKDGWQKTTLSRVNADRDFTGDRTNLGIILGAPSGNLVDVDLDWPEARLLAPHFLLPTPARFGRRSSQAAHWLYVADVPKTVQFRVSEEKAGMVVELRSTGGQTMFPPSVHPCGERLAWTGSDDSEPWPVEDADDLRNRCAAIAFAAVVLRHWTKGGRNHLGMHAAGALLDHGWEPEHAKDLLRIVMEAAGDEEAAKRDPVATTLKRKADGQEYTGLPTLAEEVNVPADKLRGWIDRRPPEERGLLLGDAPAYVARRFGDVHGDTWHWRGCFYQWDSSCWRTMTEDDLKARLYGWLEHAKVAAAKGKVKAYRPDRTKVAQVLDALAGVRHLEDAREAPFWTDPVEGDPPPVDLLPFQNGVLDLRTFALRDPDPRLFAQHRVDCAYDPAAEAPTWDRFLGEIFPGDEESVRCVEEIFGYCLSADTSQQKAFLWQGDKRSGKGTLGRVLRVLVGPDRFAAPTISSFGSNFGMQNLIGSAVAMIADARGQSRFDPHVIVERILTITGEDAQSIDRKFKLHWNGQLPTRLIYVSNVPPKLKDPSGVIVSRFIAVRFQQSFEGREDPDLTRKLLAELPGIVNRALEGVKRLRARGRFLQPETGRELLDQMDENTGPVRTFVREMCTVGPEQEIDSQTLYRVFQEWLMEHGHQKMASSTFGADLFALNEGIGKSRTKVKDPKTGKSVNGPPVYKGITLSELAPTEPMKPEVYALIDKIKGDDPPF